MKGVACRGDFKSQTDVLLLRKETPEQSIPRSFSGYFLPRKAVAPSSTQPMMLKCSALVLCRGIVYIEASAHTTILAAYLPGTAGAASGSAGGAPGGG